MAAGRPDSALAAKSVTTSIPIVFTNADSWIWWYYGSPEGLSVPHRTLHRLVEEEQQQGGGVFGPDDIAIMTKAFDLLLAECKLTDRTDPVVTMVAKLVIELVRNGERDPEKIRQKIIGGVKFL